jgi:hypothetical protein
MVKSEASITGLPSVDDYVELVQRDLVDLLGATIKVRPISGSSGKDYGRGEPRVAWIELPYRTHIVEFHRRALVFSPDETQLLRAYAAAIHEFSQVPRGFATTASEDVLTRAIAQRSSSSPENALVLETVMQEVVRYSSRTYEGVPVAMNLCLDLSEERGGEPLARFLDQPWAPVLGSGLTTAVLLAGDGSVRELIDLPPPSGPDQLAPEPFTSVAEWTSAGDRIGLSVTRSGEAYLFSGGQLLFARRSSRWRGFPLALVRGAGWFGTTKRRLSASVKLAILTSLLDASAAHHGACLGVVVNSDLLNAAKLVAPIDVWASDDNLRKQMFGAVHFQDLSRRGRLELLSMDGATILSQSGVIIAAGAILRVPGGSEGGGRTAAAHALGKYGVGIKVSQDGPVRAFANDKGVIVQQFSMG